VLVPRFPVRNRQGVVLEAVLDTAEDALAEPLLHPLTHALVVVRCQGRFLVLFNRFKQHWELPGGIIDAGETPRACAARELLEETGQRIEPSALSYRGLTCLSFPSGKREHGALYAGSLPSLTPFVENDEAARIALWDGCEDLEEVCEIDAALLAYG
jgi:8-oxo-dGTP diphosphatase